MIKIFAAPFGYPSEVAERKMKKMIQIMNMSVQGNEFSKLKRMMLSSVQLGVQKIKFSK